MFILQDVREAHQICERKFENAGRESINKNCGKQKTLFQVLGGLLARKATAGKMRGTTIKMVSTDSGAVS
jgi:hypothetical protein